MLPYFAAAGHNLYAKPDVCALFMKGYHVLRRSERYWAGLSSDLVIEKELMRSEKTTGGLTRGRGMGVGMGCPESSMAAVYASLC